MRLFALLAGFTLCLSSTSCQSYGDSSDYIPLATPVPPQLSQPVANALPRPANFPTRPVAIPPSAPRTPAVPAPASWTPSPEKCFSPTTDSSTAK